MWGLLAFALAGAAAELIDGSLGMGFGVTGSTILVASGFGPAVSSASVHGAEVFTSLASGTSHLKLGNVDRKLLWALALPGVVGGVLGAFLLSGFDSALARPLVAAILFCLGVLIVLRFVKQGTVERPKVPASRGRIAALGFTAASVDAFGGGGWGPIATPTLILGSSVEPRRAVGTVNLAEFFVTLAITVTFLATLGPSGYQWSFVAAVAVGGVLCAPAGAWITARLPAPRLGVVVGVLLVALNARTILQSAGLVDASQSLALAALSLGAVGALVVYEFAAAAVERRRAGLKGPPRPAPPLHRRLDVQALGQAASWFR